MKSPGFKKLFFVSFLIFSFSLFPVPSAVFAQVAEGGPSENLPLGPQGSDLQGLQDLDAGEGLFSDEDLSDEELLKAQQKTSQQQTSTQDNSGTSQPQDEATTPTTGDPSSEETMVTDGQPLPGELVEGAPVDGELIEPGENLPAIDPNKELVEMSQTELDQLQEQIAQIDDPALKAEMLGVVAEDLQIVVVESGPGQENNAGNEQPVIDITTPEGQTQALQQLDQNAPVLMQNGANQQTLSALKEAIGTGDKAKVEVLMTEMAQIMAPNPNGPGTAPVGDFDRGMPMPMFEMMKDLGFQGPGPYGPMEGPMGPMGGPMEIVDFKDFYAGVRVEEMGFAMMEKGGFSMEQVDQFTDRAKNELLNHNGEAMVDPRAMFEGIFKEVFGQGPMGPMEGGPMGPQGPQGFEAFAGPNGPNGPMGPMDPAMMMQGPNGPMPAGDFAAFQGPNGEFNFNEFMAQNNHMMGELNFIANADMYQGPHPGGPQGFEGPMGPQGPQGPGGFEAYAQGQAGPFQGGPFEGPMPGNFQGGPFEGPGPFNGGGFDPGGYQPPGGAEFNPAEFHGPEFQGPEFQQPEFHQPEFQPPEYQPPPEQQFVPPPGEQQQQPPPPPPELHHHDLGETPHVPGDGHPCAAPQCS